jgi:hypothetical protein
MPGRSHVVRVHISTTVIWELSKFRTTDNHIRVRIIHNQETFLSGVEVIILRPLPLWCLFLVFISLFLCFFGILAISVVKLFEVNSIVDLCLHRTMRCWHSSSLRDLVLTSRCRKDSSSHDVMFECGIGKFVVGYWLLWMFEMVFLQLVMCAFEGSFNRKYTYPSRKQPT